jgi:hypothetical protein
MMALLKHLLFSSISKDHFYIKNVNSIFVITSLQRLSMDALKDIGFNEDI